MSYTKILVPLDGSSLSEKALPLASTIAIHGGARVELVGVIQDKRVPSIPRPLSTMTRTGAGESPSSIQVETEIRHRSYPDVFGTDLNIPDYLGDVARLLNLQDIKTSCKVRTGEPAETIVREAEGEGADLIVMATHGRGGLARGLLGSVTDKTIHLSRIPIVVVRSDNAPIRWNAWPGPTTVIVPLDGSELSESALAHATAFASTFFARLILLRVMPRGAPRSEAALLERYMTALTGRLRGDGLDVHYQLVGGAPAHEIVRVAQDLADSLIVMTTRGATGLTRWQRGSVTDAVIRSATVPTVVVPPVKPLLGPAIH